MSSLSEPKLEYRALKSDLSDGFKPYRRKEDSRSGGLRHDVSLPARIEGVKGGSINVRIYDVSSSGMSLRLPMLTSQYDDKLLPVETKLNVIFAPDHVNAPDAVVNLPVVITRRQLPIIGVRFVDMSREQQRALRELAVSAVQSRANASGGSRGELSPDPEFNPRAVMVACRKVIERRLPNIIWTLRSAMVTQLKSMGLKDADELREGAQVEATTIESKGTAIARTIDRHVLQAFAELSGLDNTHELVFTRADIERAKRSMAAKKVGLVNQTSLERSVALETTCKRVESALVGKSFDNSVRLANVLRRRIDDKVNPLAPSTMCRILWEAITQYGESPRIHVCLHKVIVKNIIPLLSTLYDDLEKAMEEQGVPSSYWMGKDKGRQ